MSDRRCPYCQQVFQSARYHSQQLVCSQPPCQRQRRRDYQRQKIASDPVYRQVTLDSSQKWRRAHPGYWKQYRQYHPEQAERNRQRQQRRDQKRRLVNLANNNLATCQVMIFQSPTTSVPTSSASCQQHPSGLAPGISL